MFPVEETPYVNVRMGIDGFGLFLEGLSEIKVVSLKPGKWKVYHSGLDNLPLGIVSAIDHDDYLSIQFSRLKEDEPHIVDEFDFDTDPDGTVWESARGRGGIWHEIMIAQILEGLRRLGALAEDSNNQAKELAQEIHMKKLMSKTEWQHYFGSQTEKVDPAANSLASPSLQAPALIQPTIKPTGAGAPHKFDDIWAWMEINIFFRPPSEVENKWMERLKSIGRELEDPHRQFDRIKKPGWL